MMLQAMYCDNEIEKRISFYHVWIKGLEIMKEHNVQLSYSSAVDEYDLREEVKMKEQRMQYGTILWKYFINMH